MRILILLLYWERPEMVKNALRSVRRANEHHQDWHLAFIDDSSPTPGKPVCEEILCDHLDQVTFYNTNMTPEEKIQTGGMVGRQMNRAVVESDASVAIMLCDDDELCPDYLKNLSEFFSANDVDACYSHVYKFNPAFEDSQLSSVPFIVFNHTGHIKLAAHVDASQVAWRTSLHQKGIWFGENRTKALDFNFYRQIDAELGSVGFSGFFSQYKAEHMTALSHHNCKELWSGNSIDTKDCERMMPLANIVYLIRQNLDLGNKEQARHICEKAISLHPQENILYLLLMESCADV